VWKGLHRQLYQLAGRVALNSYGINGAGASSSSAADLVLDQGVGGHRRWRLQQIESRSDYQRTQYLSGASSLHFIWQAQMASREEPRGGRKTVSGRTEWRACLSGGRGHWVTRIHHQLEYRYRASLLPHALANRWSLVTFYIMAMFA
jgi:hypothetical protein